MIAKYIQLLKSNREGKKFKAKFYDAKRVKIKTIVLVSFSNSALVSTL